MKLYPFYTKHILFLMHTVHLIHINHMDYIDFCLIKLTIIIHHFKV